MSENAHSNLVYGMELSSEEAEQLDNTLMLLAGLDIEDEDKNSYNAVSKLKTDMLFAGDGARSSIQSTFGYVKHDGELIDYYYVGVDLGYMNIQTIKNGVTDSLKEQWKKIVPYLEKAGITLKEPDFHNYQNYS